MKLYNHLKISSDNQNYYFFKLEKSDSKLKNNGTEINKRRELFFFAIKPNKIDEIIIKRGHKFLSCPCLYDGIICTTIEKKNSDNKN